MPWPDLVGIQCSLSPSIFLCVSFWFDLECKKQFEWTSSVSYVGSWAQPAGPAPGWGAERGWRCLWRSGGLQELQALQMVAEIDTHGGQPVDLKTAVASCHQDWGWMTVSVGGGGCWGRGEGCRCFSPKTATHHCFWRQRESWQGVSRDGNLALLHEMAAERTMTEIMSINHSPTQRHGCSLSAHPLTNGGWCNNTVKQSSTWFKKDTG